MIEIDINQKLIKIITGFKELFSGALRRAYNKI